VTIRKLLASFALVFSSTVGLRIAMAGDIEECASAHLEAQKLRERAHLVTARAQLVACSNARCPRPIAKQCSVWLAEIERDMPTILIEAKDASGSDVLDLEVLLDGALIVQSAAGDSIAVDPGRHTLRFRSAGLGEVTQDIVVRVTEKNRRVTVRFDGPVPEARDSTANLPLAAVPPVDPSRSGPDLGSRSGKAVPPVDPSRSGPDLGSRSGKAVPPVDPSRSGPSATDKALTTTGDETAAHAVGQQTVSPWAWVLGGVGAAALTSVAIIGFSGQRTFDDCRDHGCSPSTETRLEVEQRFAWGAAIVGVLCSGAAAWLFFDD
jgi:hypothetical protein